MKKILFLLPVFLVAFCPFTFAQRINTNEIQVRQRTSTPSCASGKGILWFDDATNVFKVCENGGSVMNLIGAGSGDALVANPISQFAGGTTSAQFAGLITNETGSGLGMYQRPPTLTTPVLGVATATSINKVAFTAPASAATLTIADGKTATFSNSITFAGTDSTVMTFPGTSATIARTDAANTFTGVQTMTSPSITTSLVTGSTTFALLNTTATTVNAFGATTTLNIGASAATVLNFGGHTSAAEFRFLEPSGSGTNYSAFKAVAQGASITYSLPPTVGAAGTVLTDVAGDGVLTWEAGGGGGGAPTDATYITQTANGSLSAEQALSSLSTGIMRVATTTGVITSLTNSAGIAANISDETGTGVMVFGTAPAFTTSISTPSILTASGALTITPASNANVFLNTTGFLQLGGQSASFAAIRDDGFGQLAVRNGDNSADGSVIAGVFGVGSSTRNAQLDTDGVKIASNKVIAFSDSTSAGSTKDAGLARNAAGVVEINNGSAGTFRDLKARDVSLSGGVATGVGGSVAGTFTSTEGTAPSLTANSFSIYSPTDVAAGGLAYVLPAAAGTGVMLATNSSGVMTISHVATTGSDNVVRATGPTLTNPAITSQTLTDGATINWDTNSGNVASVTLGGNRTMAAPTNLKAGGSYVLRVIQDGTGSRTVSWNSVFKWPGGTAPTLTTTASRTDLVTCVSDGTNLHCNALLDVR